jgi:NAD(P)-dependent dehydrogenase (short-subunit alcohol dehydrogenase family)
VAKALLEAGAHVIIISSTEARVQDAVKRLDSPHASGKASDIRDEAAITQLLRELAPLDHVLVSSVDKILLGPLVDTELDLAKNLFGVKFWGSIIVAKGESAQESWFTWPRLTRTSFTDWMVRPSSAQA